MNTQQIVDSYRSKYSEWAEELGENFPQFLVYKLAADLAKEKNKNEFLNKVAYATYSK